MIGILLLITLILIFIILIINCPPKRRKLRTFTPPPLRMTNLDKLFNDLESNFNMEHSCDCLKWCTCWKDFKNKYIKNNQL